MYRRQIEIIGAKNQEILKNKSVLIVGAGGLGNIIASTISCIGLKEIFIIDFDVVEIHNIHRQMFFNESDVGKSKSIMLSEKLDKRCKDTKIIGIDAKFEGKFDKKIDIIFDATDNFETRKKIDLFAKELNIPWIYASVEDLMGQVGVFKNTSFDIFASKKHIPKGQISPMVNLIGSIASMLGIKTLINFQDEVLYFIEFKDDLVIKKFKF